MNIRIYKLTQGSCNPNNDFNVSLRDYDEWRDINFYDYVREYIVKPKISPNFIMLYGYYISENSKIDFDKIAAFRGITIKSESPYINGRVIIPLVPKAHAPMIPTSTLAAGKTETGISYFNPYQMGGNNGYVDIKTKNDESGKKTVEFDLNPNPKAFLGKALIGLTEAPNYNLLGWASKTYQMDGNIRRVINTGFHLDKVWYSIIFQIMVATYCLQIHKIFFTDFTAEDNIYIKDVNVYGMPTKFWKFIIDGIPYYVPNYGYIVLIDSNFKDINDPNGESDKLCQFRAPKSDRRKIYAKFLDDNLDNNTFHTKTFEAFVKALDSNVYDQSFINYGGCPPPPEIKHLLGAIKTEVNSDANKHIGNYIFKYMRPFINNRVGTFLKENETINIRKDEQRDFKKGQMVVYEEATSSYKFVIFVELAEGGVAFVLTKNEPTNSDIIDLKINIGSLYGYSKIEQIQQNFKPNESLLSEDELLETYIINAN